MKGGYAQPGLLSIIAIDPLAPLVALLRLDGERRDRPGVEPAQADGLACFLAIAIGAVVDSLERGIDLGNELALAVAGPKLERPVGFGRGAVGKIGENIVVVLEMRQRLAA